MDRAVIVARRAPVMVARGELVVGKVLEQSECASSAGQKSSREQCSPCPFPVHGIRAVGGASTVDKTGQKLAERAHCASATVFVRRREFLLFEMSAAQMISFCADNAYFMNLHAAREVMLMF